jgi:hypothetical protein
MRTRLYFGSFISQLTIQLTPKRSAQKLFSSGMVTLPPSDMPAKVRSASATSRALTDSETPPAVRNRGQSQLSKSATRTLDKRGFSFRS